MDAPADLVGRTHRALRAVAAHEPGGATTTAVARAAGLPRPTVHRLLTSLQGVGLVEREPETDHWVLGPELYFLGVAAGRRYDVTEAALPVVRRLALATGESAFFSARRGEETICLIREDGPFPIRSHVLFEGARFPLGVVSAGMVILAHLPEREVADYLRHVDLTADYGPQHAPAEIRRHIAATRKNGYALNPGLVVEGSWGLAAAVFDQAGSPRWALTLTGVEHRFGAARVPQLGALLLREAHALSETLARRS
ncbi:IclR family transcriptional regulator [Amycolatopsis australiensis]|uniref:DNA-binding transcriptional regulator, IclR family n=1 Tax=Amycolatopsis australiensis TaxID=546364 RepID=A0A1K1S3S3_9PSEU|nr:IclR family transcriptional regulator [Amycolatopsis australiensis]SFW78993.1 DNA-binding transcriptional regulator, IclR family [Amycolatopsis australiensis]